MVRRKETRKKMEERAFPIRIVVNWDNPIREMVRLGRVEGWLTENLGEGNFGSHQAPTWAQARAFYFRRVEDAHRFITAHPEIRLLDATDSVEHLRQAQNAFSSEKDRREPRML